MSQIGSVNGWPLLQMPPVPGPRQVDWRAVDVVGAVTNPYTGRQQTQSWQAGWLEATVTMPPMLRSQANAWIAFLLQAQGQQAVFYFGDGLAVNPLGTGAGMGQTNGSFQTGYQLTTNNWTPNQFALFSPGDWLQIGYRLYRCMDQPMSDASGNASFAIWPQIREVPASGTPIVTVNPQGLFRMASNVRQWSESYMRTIGLSFTIREAL